jgi:uncharacterized protein (UPF0335 family)
MRKQAKRILFLRLYNQEDDDIIAWVEELEREQKTVSLEIKEAIRQYMSTPANRNGIDAAELRAMIMDIVRDLGLQLGLSGQVGEEREGESKLIDSLIDDMEGGW